MQTGVEVTLGRWDQEMENGKKRSRKYSHIMFSLLSFPFKIKVGVGVSFFLRKWKLGESGIETGWVFIKGTEGTIWDVYGAQVYFL